MDQGENSYRLFLQGDDDGLVQIIRDYKDGLILYLNGYVQNLTTAEDLAEETFLKLALRKPRFLANSSFRTWLYAIGRNLALDYRRHNKKREISLEDSPEAILEEMDLEKAYINQEEKRSGCSSISCLSLSKDTQRRSMISSGFGMMGPS